MNITPELLNDLKEKAQKATPGEWYWLFIPDRKFTSITTHDRRWACMPGIAAVSMTNYDDKAVDIEIEQNANAEYIAAANPAIVLELIASYERLQKENAELMANN